MKLSKSFEIICLYDNDNHYDDKYVDKKDHSILKKRRINLSKVIYRWITDETIFLKYKNLLIMVID